MYFYVWDNNDKQLSGNWPGKRISTTRSILGKRWYYQTYRITSPDNYINLVVNAGTGNKQTVDITGIRTDSYLCITSSKDNGKYIVEDMTEDIETGMESLTPNRAPMGDGNIYNLAGQIVNAKSLNKKRRRGIFIEAGRKIVY